MMRRFDGNEGAALVDDGRAVKLVLPATAVQPRAWMFGVFWVLPLALGRVALRPGD
jgi:hypothetical protein